MAPGVQGLQEHRSGQAVTRSLPLEVVTCTWREGRVLRHMASVETSTIRIEKRDTSLAAREDWGLSKRCQSLLCKASRQPSPHSSSSCSSSLSGPGLPSQRDTSDQNLCGF